MTQQGALGQPNQTACLPKEVLQAIFSALTPGCPFGDDYIKTGPNTVKYASRVCYVAVRQLWRSLANQWNNIVLTNKCGPGLIASAAHHLDSVPEPQRTQRRESITSVVIHLGQHRLAALNDL